MKSLNKVQLIGNLTRDPELKYTPQGTAVCTFGVATNRQWTTESGEKKDEADFHKIVAWTKLAEICANLLKKGRKVYVEGRLQTRNWQGQDGTQRTTTEIVINDMIILDKKEDGMGTGEIDIPEQVAPEVESQDITEEKPAPKKKGKAKAASEPEPSEDDIPF
jgi:single-strand DNA-binding protein